MDPLSGTQRLKAARRTLLLFLASTLLTVGLAEVAFRVVHHFRPVFFLPRTDYNQFRAAAGSLHSGHVVNSLGFNDREVSIEKPEGIYRILGLGDSFAFGVVPYPDNYLTLLEDHLDHGRGQVEVVNMGIPRIGPASYLALLEHEGLRMEPDLVVLSFYIGNDFNLPPQEDKFAPKPGSYVAAFLRYLFIIRPQFEGLEYDKNESYRDDQPTLQREGYFKILRRKLRNFNPADPQKEQKLRYVTTTLERIRDLCRERGIPLFVVILPDEIQIDFALRQELFEAFPGLDPADFSFQAPNRRLHRRLEYLEIPYLDLLPRFRAEPLEVPLYKPRDTHWNRRGNAVAAEALTEHLRRTGWVP
jgi:hypothetical protein